MGRSPLVAPIGQVKSALRLFNQEDPVIFGAFNRILGSYFDRGQSKDAGSICPSIEIDHSRRRWDGRLLSNHHTQGGCPNPVSLARTATQLFDWNEMTNPPSPHRTNAQPPSNPTQPNHRAPLQATMALLRLLTLCTVLSTALSFVAMAPPTGSKPLAAQARATTASAAAWGVQQRRGRVATSLNAGALWVGGWVGGCDRMYGGLDGWMDACVHSYYLRRSSCSGFMLLTALGCVHLYYTHTGKGSMRMAMERTYIMAKPDALQVRPFGRLVG
jgi:hypothetical protein